DRYGNGAPASAGTAHCPRSAARPVLPANYAFKSIDAGTHTFRVTLKTAGSQSITVTDTANSSLAASVTGITVTPAPLSVLALGGVPGSTTAGSAFNVTLTASDAYGNTITGYTGTVHFTTSDVT